MAFIYPTSRDVRNGKSHGLNGSQVVPRPPWVLDVCLKCPASGVVAIPLIRRRSAVASELQPI